MALKPFELKKLFMFVVCLYIVHKDEVHRIFFNIKYI